MRLAWLFLPCSDSLAYAGLVMPPPALLPRQLRVPTPRAVARVAAALVLRSLKFSFQRTQTGTCLVIR